MKTAKLILGIITLVLSVVILFQSCAAGIGGALSNGTDTSGGTGVFVALFLIAAGIVGIVSRSSKGATIAATIIYAIAGIIGVTSSGIFADLVVWGVISLIFAVIFGISIFKQDYGTGTSTSGDKTEEAK